MIRKRVVAAVLVIVLCMTFAPRSVLQAAADGIKEIDFTTDANVAEIEVDDISIGEKPSDNIVMEYVEDRTETEKKFLMDDGSIMVRQYAAPIHIKTKTDSFKKPTLLSIPKTHYTRLKIPKSKKIRKQTG